MPRPYFVPSDTHPYHVTARCNNQEFFPLPLSEVWGIMIRQLEHLHKEHKLAIHAFVLMGNHFHLLCHTPQADLDQIMQKFMRSVSMTITRRARSQNHLWGGRYRWSIIESQTHYYQVYRYIYQNPLRARIVSKVEDYPYSTLKPVPFPVHSFVPLSFAGMEGELLWLNERYDQEDVELIKLGLRRHQFDVSRRKIKAFNRLSLPSKSHPE